MTTVTEANLQKAIDDYLAKLRTLQTRIEEGSPYDLLLRLKRTPVDGGPYPGVSVFETANRVLSDLVILFGLRRLFSGADIAGVRFPFQTYLIALGTQSGPDLQAEEGPLSLRGEAFNVASTFYQTKRAQALRRLRTQSPMPTHRIVLFNSDAVSDPSAFPQATADGIVFIPVEVEI
jgi:hypothetical protein